MFSDSPESDLLGELSSLAEELHMPQAAQSKPLFKPIAILYLFANIQDRWPKRFISEAVLSRIVSWCRKNRSKLPRSTSLVTSWEHFLTRLLLQHIEIAVREEALFVGSACAYFKLCMRLIECSDSSVRDGIIHTLLGPYLPFVAELMHLEEKKSFVHTLVSDILEPTSPFNQIFSNARFFEIASLRKFFLGELFDRFIMCFPQVPIGQHPHSLAFGAADHERFNRLHSILSSLNQDSSYNGLEQSQLNVVQRILLVLTHFPSSYLSPNYRAILLLAVRVHQELLSSWQDPPIVLQAGWEINLSLICTLVDSDLALVRQKRNQKSYIFWLLDTVTHFLAKLPKQTHLLIDQLTHISGSGLILTLSHSSEDEADLSIFDDRYLLPEYFTSNGS
ncbi:hypothetical protein DSO57_1039202 [Entomophthora muscae]|uniref:Uncharacterized protein n=1 Tax=Entomophthora muscae TaxID=34485 RepID=A0ACC2UIE8_9FUNG|nr:hypothetical protein DSO57_1039202 [Entomophthora muscae]